MAMKKYPYPLPEKIAKELKLKDEFLLEHPIFKSPFVVKRRDDIGLNEGGIVIKLHHDNLFAVLKDQQLAKRGQFGFKAYNPLTNKFETIIGNPD